jgi:transposase
VSLVGVEGTGSYGAGLTRQLERAGIAVVEVDRPNRQVRRREGKSDPVDAVVAARAALSGQALGQPKSRNGDVEAIRVLTIARRSAASEAARWRVKDAGRSGGTGYVERAERCALRGPAGPVFDAKAVAASGAGAPAIPDGAPSSSGATVMRRST